MKKIDLRPAFASKIYGRLRIALDSRRRRKMSTRKIFTEIYEKKLWGGKEEFNSGSGSSEGSVTAAYVKKITAYLKSQRKKPTVVDLGCGDFQIGRQLTAYCSSYTGVDIVPNLIKKLDKTAKTKNIKFLCLDIVADPLPAGEIVFVRQVLQHLSNDQISAILKKLKAYKTVFVTEHYPTDRAKIKPNKDIVAGSAIRLYQNSGVYLDKPPFNLPKKFMKKILEVPGTGMGKGFDQGVIRTYQIDWPPSAKPKR